MKKEYTAKDHTFVACAYEENPYLDSLLSSLKKQTTCGNVLVSTSTPNKHICDVCKRHNVDLVINDGESSIAHDWNYGYNQAKTSLVTIAHQDDCYEPSYVETVIAALNADDGNAGIVHTGYYELRDGTRVDDNKLLRIKRLMNNLFKNRMKGSSVAAKRRSLSFGDFICCPSVTFVKDVVGPSVFDIAYANSCDWRTWINLANRNVRFLYVPDMLIGHRIYAESTTTKNIESNIRATEDLEILETLWPRPIARAIFAAYSTSEQSNS